MSTLDIPSDASGRQSIRIALVMLTPSSSSSALSGDVTAEPTDHGRSASDTVFFGIMNGLELGSFVPGQRLVETDLVAQFGVGRNSVREALQRLAAEGIVELPRHRGAMIRRLSLQDTLDVLDV